MVDDRGMTTAAAPARAAHGWFYWLSIGWLWEPLAWMGRVTLWLVFLPLGVFLSWRKARANAEGRLRRGVRRR